MGMLHTIENLSKKNKSDTKGSATASSGAATLNTECGFITTESLSTANAADYTLTLTCGTIRTDSMVFWTIANGTNTTAGTIGPHSQVITAGQVVQKFRNSTGSSLNGTLVLAYLVV